MMSLRKTGIIRFVIAFSLFAPVCLPAVNAQETKKPFTVVDDIGLTLFHNPNGDSMDSVLFSPDGNYFAVYSQRGRLDVGRLVVDHLYPERVGLGPGAARRGEGRRLIGDRAAGLRPLAEAAAHRPVAGDGRHFGGRFRRPGSTGRGRRRPWKEKRS